MGRSVEPKQNKPKTEKNVTNNSKCSLVHSYLNTEILLRDPVTSKGMENAALRVPGYFPFPPIVAVGCVSRT